MGPSAEHATNEHIRDSDQTEQSKTSTRFPWAIVLVAVLTILVVVLTIAVLTLTVVHAVHYKDVPSDDLMEIVDFTKALLWPAVAVFVVGVLHKPLADFLGNVGKVTWKSGDNQVILERLERKKKTVAALVTAATAAAPPSTRDPRSEDGRSDIVPNTLSTSEVVHLASDVGQTITARSVRHFEKGRILWVDDQPLKNKYLIEAFRELGIRVDLAESTEGALAYVDRNHRYAALITDMGRPGDSTAGYTFLEALRKRGNSVPLIIYVGSDSEEERRKAEASESTNRPHVETTDRPERVFNFVTEILRDAKV